MSFFLQARSSKLKALAGFTLVELFVYLALFVIVAISFVGILLSITRVQLRQTATSEVNEQSQLLLQTIQRYVEQSSLVEMNADAASSTLKLRIASSSADPTYIYLATAGGIGTVYLRETDSGSAQPLTTSRVNVNNLTFTKRQNPPGKDSVSVSFTVSYNNASNPQRFFQRALSIAISRVSAATFDSNVIPSVNNTYKIGASSQAWQSINDLMYFANGNVGIGGAMSNPQQKLEIDGGVKLNTTTAQPVCGATTRGTLWFIQSGGVATDTLQLCVRLPSGSYTWARLY